MSPSFLDMTRRNFFRNSLGVVANLQLAPLGFASTVQNSDDPHFFFQIFIQGGWDVSYLWDARPLEMTTAKLIQNYLKEEPELLTDSWGRSTRITRLVKPVMNYFDHFSILNGVLMEPNFDGHDQNEGYWLTGNPFGGDCFLPNLLSEGKARPLDYVQVSPGSFMSQITNAGNSAPLDKSGLSSLQARIKSTSALSRSSLTSFSKRSLAQGGLRPGLFQMGALAMANGMNSSAQLSESLAKIELPDSGLSTMQEASSLACQLFRSGVTSNASYIVPASIANIPIDMHAGSSAQQVEVAFTQLTKEIAEFLRVLIDTPYNDSRSMMDVTTFAITSEFGRTMCQPWNFENSGTDHNSLTNSVIIGGKGIRPGQVIGASDFQSSQEVLSQAHLGFDKQKIKMMGQPFDYKSGFNKKLDPATPYLSPDYLNAANVINTLQHLFKVDSTKFRTIGRNQPPAEILSTLLL